MTEPIKTAIIYYSATGTVHKLAEAIARGASSQNSEVRLLPVTETVPADLIATNETWERHRTVVEDLPVATPEDMEWADVVFFGSPTRYGNVASQLKAFLDSLGSLWLQGVLTDKIYSGFTSSATRHGGQETTLIALYTTIYHWGGIVVTPGYADPLQFQSGNPYGASHTSNNGETPPGELEIAAAEFQGRRVVDIAAAFQAGRTARA